ERHAPDRRHGTPRSLRPPATAWLDGPREPRRGPPRQRSDLLLGRRSGARPGRALRSGFYAVAAKRSAARARLRSASTSRSRGAAVVTSEARSFAVDSATWSTARSKASSFARDGFVKPLTLRTYWSAAP